MKLGSPRQIKDYVEGGCHSRRPRLNEVRSCILKLMVMLLDRIRQAQRERQSTPVESELPMLWILSPSASPTLIDNLGAKAQPLLWPEGVFLAVNVLRTGFVAIDRLPETEDTLLLRLLGRGRTLERAIAQLLDLPPQESKRNKALQLLANWKVRTLRDPTARGGKPGASHDPIATRLLNGSNALDKKGDKKEDKKEDKKASISEWSGLDGRRSQKF